MNILTLFLLSLLASCSSGRIYKLPLMEYKVTASYDPVSRSIHRDIDYANGILMYKKLVETKQINNDPAWSCFRSAESTNYVEVEGTKLKYFRSLHVDESKVISYKKKDMHSKVDGRDYYYRKYSEEVVEDNIHINSKKCIITKDRIKYYVTSEKYKQK